MPKSIKVNSGYVAWFRSWIAGIALLAWVFSLMGCGGGGTAAPSALTSTNNPSVGFIIPNVGPSTGGTVVTIIGSNIQTDAAVSFGGSPSPSVTFITSAKITAVTPAHAVGVVDVLVTNSSIGSTTVTGGFTYNPPPTITSVSPAVGTIGGGTAVTITGTNFVSGATVTFGTTPSAAVVFSSSTQIVAAAPPHAAGTVSVIVTNPDGGTATAAGAFTYGLPPSISTISPNNGPTTGGQVVTITGAQFQPGAVVTFGGVAGVVSSVSADGTTIVVTSPAHAAGTVDVTVTNPDTRFATLPGSFTFLTAISIASIAPNTGPIAGGTAVTITGTDFQLGALVFIGGSPAGAILVVSSTQITCTTPAQAAGAADVMIVNPDTTTATLTGGFTYTAPTTTTPTISSISPASGPLVGGTVVTILGTDFQTGATVTFGGVAGTAVTVTPTTQIQVTTPAGAALGAVDVKLTNPDATTVTSTGGFTYGNPPPTLVSISPSSGPIAGGTVVTLTGTGFLAGATVTVGGVPMTGVVVVSSIQITAVTPAHVAATDDVVVTNTDGQSASLPASFTFSLGTFTIVTDDLPVGNAAATYYATVLTASGTGPFTWTITSGSLPPGLTLNGTTGVISGIPSATGTSNFTAQVVDSTAVPGPQTASKAMSISIVTPALAAIPAAFIDTTFPDTTAYTVVHLAAGGNLQTALNSASCNPTGTVIMLQSGATFTAPPSGFTLPALTCAPNQWIIITTDSSTIPAPGTLPPGTPTSLPPQGTRIDPTYSPILAKVLSGNSAAVFQTVFNSSHFWLMGLEISLTPANALTVATENFGLVIVGKGETLASQLPDHIYVDRCYVHGTPTQYVKKGVQVNGIDIAVVDSYLTEFHVTAQDTQAVGGWNGPGPIKIVNNFLEASTEIILFGGADPTLTNNVPSDIEIRRNHFFKPLAWKIGDPSYAGIPWQVKNFLEFKDAARVLVEGNVMEQNWLAAQQGYGVLFTPRNQGGTCPLCSVNDINFRYNIVRHSGSGAIIAGEDGNHQPSLPSDRIDIHDDLFEDINGTTWGSSATSPVTTAAGDLIVIANAGAGNPKHLLPPLNLAFNHNTGFETGHALTLGDDVATDLIVNFSYSNNIAGYNAFGVLGSGLGAGVGTLGLVAYLAPPFSFLDNVLVAPPPSVSGYPATTFFPLSFDPGVGFVDFAGGDFRLTAASPFHNAGSDGKDIGADVSAVNAATAGTVAPNDL